MAETVQVEDQIVSCGCCKRKKYECQLQKCAECAPVTEDNVIYDTFGVFSWCSCNRKRSTQQCDGTGFVQNECDGDHQVIAKECTGSGPTPYIIAHLPTIVYNSGLGDPSYTIEGADYVLSSAWNDEAAFPGLQSTNGSNCANYCSDRFGYMRFNGTTCNMGYGGKTVRTDLTVPHETLTCSAGSFAFDFDVTFPCSCVVVPNICNTTLFGTITYISEFTLYYNPTTLQLVLQIGNFKYGSSAAQIIASWQFPNPINCKGVTHCSTSGLPDFPSNVGYIQRIVGGSFIKYIDLGQDATIEVVYP